MTARPTRPLALAPIFLVSILLFTANAFAAAPTVTAISPNNGPAAGGTSVAITGAGFIAGSTVKFGSTSASGVVVHSSTSITATSPSGSGMVDVAVTNTNGTSASTPTDQFAYDPSRSGPWLGLDGNSEGFALGHIDDFTAHGIVYDRGFSTESGGIEYAAGEEPKAGDDLERSIDAGMIPVVTIDYDGYEGWGPNTDFPRTSEQISDYVTGFIATAKAIRERYPGKEVLFEAMNEPWGNTAPHNNGAQYADVIAQLLPAVAASSIPSDDVYVVGFGADMNAKEEWTEGWIPSMYEAQPALEKEVQGWSFLPLGPPKGSEFNNSEGIEGVPAIREFMLSGENNIIVSAVGYCALDVESGGLCREEGGEVATDSTQAAEWLTETLQTAKDYHEAGWLKALIVAARNYGGFSMQLEGGSLTKEGEALDSFADTYTPRPAVSAISENNGAVAGGTSVTITGARFASGDTVKFGSAAATGVTVHSSTSITATSPSGTGLGNVTVSGPYGTSIETPYDQFAYDPAPTKPWLGLNGNNSTYLGPIGAFVEHEVVYDRSGPVEWVAGESLEEGGKPSEGGAGLEADFEHNMVPVVTIEYKGYDGEYKSDPDFPTEEGSSTTLREYVEGFVKSASEILKKYPEKKVLFEPMNEPWGYTTPQYNGAEYADVIAKLLPAAEEAGIPLSDIYVGATGMEWVPEMYAAQPSLETEIQGWYFHPYGPPSGTEYYDVEGIQSLPVVQAEMTSGQNNIIVSEVGYCAEDVNEGRGCGDGSSSAKTSTEAAAKLTEMLKNALPYHEAGWLRALLVYSRNDGGWAMQLPGGELTAEGKALIEFAEAHG